MTKDEALKLALEALEKSHICPLLPDDCSEAITAIKEALAQPEQEPVAWVHHLTFKNLNSFERSRYSTTLAKKQTDACCIPLYTNPPQRTWVGLTEKDILEAAVKSQEGISPRNDTLRFATAIEAKLKEKNNG